MSYIYDKLRQTDLSIDPIYHRVIEKLKDISKEDYKRTLDSNK